MRVQRGHLEIEDGVGTERRKFRLPRVGHRLRRLILIGEDGFVSLSALKWLSDQGAAFVMLERNGKVLVTTGPVHPSDARLRRAQALSHTSKMALTIARELIGQKLVGQEQVARHKLQDSRTADKIAHFREDLLKAESLKTVSIIEAQAAGHYWSAFRTLPVNFPRKDENRVPEHWRTFGNRASALTGSPRRAVNPANAILNYLYSLLEAESRLALAVLGLDPGIGILHVDTPNRDSLPCDLIEPLRGQVDAFLVRWLTTGTLRREWFIEQSDGACRLTRAFTAYLSETAPTWGRGVAPIAEWIANTLWSSTRKSQSERSIATRLTQQRRSEGRGNEYAPPANLAPRQASICSGCGTTTKGGRSCTECGRETSRVKLIEVAKLGRLIGHSAESRKKQSETMKRHEISKREWKSTPKPSCPSEKTYIEEIQPRLSTVTIAKIASTLGISEPYAAGVRAGKYRPHPRHWWALAGLAAEITQRKQRPDS